MTDTLAAIAAHDTTHRDHLGYRDDNPTMAQNRAGAASHVLLTAIKDNAADSPEEALTTLLADLHHLTDALGLNWAEIAGNAADLHALDVADAG